MKHSEKILACGERLSLPPAIRRVFWCALLLVSLLFLFYYGDRILLVLIWGITGVLFVIYYFKKFKSGLPEGTN